VLVPGRARGTFPVFPCAAFLYRSDISLRLIANAFRLRKFMTDRLVEGPSCLVAVVIFEDTHKISNTRMG
jgi:hypothetical protein